MKSEGLNDDRLCRTVNIWALYVSPSTGTKSHFNHSLWISCVIYLFIYNNCNVYVRKYNYVIVLKSSFFFGLQLLDFTEYYLSSDKKGY